MVPTVIACLKHVNATLAGLGNTATSSNATVDATNTVSAKTERVFASPDGMESIAPWKVARIVAPRMGSVALIPTVLGSAGVTADGMERIAAYC